MRVACYIFCKKIFSMKKLIFRKFTQDTLVFFAASVLIMALIVWTLQAVNYFDFVTQDGHGLKVYFFYTILNFPKIVHRILPFIFFLSLFYTIVNYELKNELSIFWINGISKIKFTNKIIFFSIIIMIFQIWLGSYVSPISQFKAREYLKNSNVDFFTSLIKEGKFINVVKGLTIFIKKKNDDGSYSDIYLDDSTKNYSKMIYAKYGVIFDNKEQKIFKLFEGKVINNEQTKINIFEFDQIDFNLADFSTNTITEPKVQELGSLKLLSCFFFLKDKNINQFKCEDSILNEMKQELLKRLYKPLYIPIVTILCCFLIVTSKSNTSYEKNKKIIFTLTFILLVLSETSLRYSASSSLSMVIYLIGPWAMFITAYTLFYRRVKNV
jgi:lipopolysaccharide export system permease protein